MSRWLYTEQSKGKRLRTIERTRERVEPERLGRSVEQRYVRECIDVDFADNARTLITAGQGMGWRFLLREDGHVDLWTPANENPTSYKIRNQMLATVVGQMSAHGALAIIDKADNMVWHG